MEPRCMSPWLWRSDGCHGQAFRAGCLWEFCATSSGLRFVEHLVGGAMPTACRLRGLSLQRMSLTQPMITITDRRHPQPAGRRGGAAAGDGAGGDQLPVGHRRGAAPAAGEAGVHPAAGARGARGARAPQPQGGCQE